MALYDLRKGEQREKFTNRCNRLLQQGAIVELVEKTKRSNNQNRYLHLLLGYLAMHFGHSLEYVKSVYYKKLANPDLFIERVEDPITGLSEMYLKSSAKLTKEEMTLSIERLRDWASQEADFYLPSANEDEWLRQIEIDMSHNRRWIGD